MSACPTPRAPPLCASRGASAPHTSASSAGCATPHLGVPAKGSRVCARVPIHSAETPLLSPSERRVRRRNPRKGGRSNTGVEGEGAWVRVQPSGGEVGSPGAEGERGGTQPRQIGEGEGASGATAAGEKGSGKQRATPAAEGEAPIPFAPELRAPACTSTSAC